MVETSPNSSLFARLAVLKAVPWFRLALSAAVLLPLFAIARLGVLADVPVWQELSSVSLWRYVRNTLLVASMATLIATVIGCVTASMIGLFDFPGRRVLAGAMILPMAMPAYVIAFVYTDLLEYAGPVQQGLRWIFGWSSKTDYWFPEIRSLPMAGLMLALVLYPYVYLVATVALSRTGQSLMDASRILDASAWSRYFRLILPMLFPALSAGALIVAMESMADFGTVDFFAVPVLTTGLYDVWINRGNLAAAAQLALVLLLVVAVLFWLERRYVARMELGQQGKSGVVRRIALTGGQRLGVYAMLGLPLVLGFILPCLRLLQLSFSGGGFQLSDALVQALITSLKLGAASSVVTVGLCFLLISSLRLAKPGQAQQGLASWDRMASLGYAVPGLVLGLGLLLVTTQLDRWLSAILFTTFDLRPRLWITGGLAGLVLAYTIRFLATAYNSIEANSKRISPSTEYVARILGRSERRILGELHIPLLSHGIMIAGILVFVDTMKELPATLLLRPFNIDTLATQVYQYAGDGLLEQSAVGALLIVVASLLPVALLARTLR